MYYPSHYSAKQWLVSPEFPFNTSRTQHPEGHPVHTHDFFELVYVLRGKALHIVDGKKYPISKEDLFLLNPEESHGYEVSTSRGIEIINCFFLPSLVNDPECLEPCYNSRRHKLHLTGALNIKVRELLDTMFDELVHKRVGFKQVIKAYLVELLVTLNRVFEQQEKEEKLGGHLSDFKKQAIWSAVKYIEENYKENFRLAEIAARAHLHPNYFCEVFKKMMGKTVIEYRNEMRIRESRYLLRSPSFNVTSVSLEVGFNDLTYFERIFKRYVGLSPRDYKARL